MRKKVKLAFMENRSARLHCLKNRRRNFMKKVEELSVLCGVEAFAVVYSPDEPGFAVWPRNEAEAQQVLLKYQTIPEDAHQADNKLDQEKYLEGLISKLEAKQRVQLKRTDELEFAYLMDEVHFGKGLDGMDLHEVNSLSLLIKDRLRNLRERAKKLEITTKNGVAIDAMLYENK